MVDTLRWGILGAGRIARTFAQGLAESRTGTLRAVGSRSAEKANAFGNEFKLGAASRHGSYEALLADPDVDAVYIATPHPLHAEWTVKAAEAGKHILCEKPLTMNAAEATAVMEAARRHDVFLMEAFMYRCHPQTARIVELVKDGAIGDVRLIQATFSFHAGFDPDGRLFNNALGGGGILDVGCYPVSLARLVAGAAAGKDFLDPVNVVGCGHLGPTGVDEWAAATLEFPGGIIAQVATGVALQQENVARVFGSDGWFLVHSPWGGERGGGTTKITLHRKGNGNGNAKQPEEILTETDRQLFSFEADIVAEYIEARQAPSPAMTWADTLGNMKTLDRWRDAIGLVYDSEKPDANWPTIHRRPLAKRAEAPVPSSTLPGLAKPVSRLVMGQVNQATLPAASVLWDEFFESGGNCFDSAYIYGGGRSERILGRWIANRGVRDQVVLLNKSAHSPHCYPEALTKQLLESLERLGTDCIDIYMMHRDNLDVPVGEFVEVLNEHQQAGRITVFGGSNWTNERVEAFNAYAADKGLAGMVALSNNFSLARLVEAPWAGCLASSAPEFKVWHERVNFPLMPWSSQAQGFFTERAHPDRRDHKGLVRSWYSDDNFERQARAKQLAKKRGALPIQIALAYVLCQPFPTFPLIGPRDLAELRTSLPAVQIELSPQDLAWLNLED